jgi:hypothetical protein
MRATLNLLVALLPAHKRADRTRCRATSNDHNSELLFGAKTVATFGTIIAIAVLVLAFVPQISLAARVQMTAELWFIDLWGFMVGVVGGGSLCDLLMGSRIHAHRRVDAQTMWTPKSRIGAAVQVMFFLAVSAGVGFFMANAFLHGMHPKPLQ